ncbi:hypothetical protein J2X77_001360 [Sphingobacterium sp. 2149]|nr:hypothetical protein [Sphingobacterium sp. 2149]
MIRKFSKTSNSSAKWILRFDLCQSFRSDGASYYGSNDATLVV